jgi:hypothetical protein
MLLTYDKLKKAIKNNGFNYVKIELEANVDGEIYCENCENGYNNCEFCGGSGSEDCDICGGTGHVSVVCPHCNGEGEVTNTETTDLVLPLETRDTCPQCMGTGLIDEICGDCSGHGTISCDECAGAGRLTCENCHGDYITYSSDTNEFLKVMKQKLGDFRRNIKFIKCYEDGSVNTEVTVTLNVRYLDKWEFIINCFKETCEQYDKNWNIDNAGMHIALLQDGIYPSIGTLHSKKIRNFKISMDKIIQSMYLLCSGNKISTRKIKFRKGMVSSQDKYSAIYTKGDTCIEYRIFDPCYLNPERIRFFFTTIVRTLKFYNEKRILGDKRLVYYNPRTKRRVMTIAPSKKLIKTSDNSYHTDLVDFYGQVLDEQLFDNLKHIHHNPHKVEILQILYDEKKLRLQTVIEQLSS